MVLLSSMTSTFSPLSFDLPSNTCCNSPASPTRPRVVLRSASPSGAIEAAPRNGTRFNISVSGPLMRTVHSFECRFERDAVHRRSSPFCAELAERSEAVVGAGGARFSRPRHYVRLAPYCLTRDSWSPARSALTGRWRGSIWLRLFACSELRRGSMSDRVRLGVVMDPIDHIKPVKDTTLGMLLAAQARGWELTYLELPDLWLRDGTAWGRTRRLAVRKNLDDWFTLSEGGTEKLADLDVILMRKDPPFDTEYIYSTYILERAEAGGALVVNRPQGLRDMNEKVYTAWFPDCCAPTLITRNMADMAAFLLEHQKVGVKPLDGMGGRSIFVIQRCDKNTNVVFETLTDYGQRYAIVQRYLPEIVTRGDARVLLVDGEPVPYGLARIPTETDNRGNLAAGARGEGRPLSERDRWLAGSARRCASAA